MRARHADVAPVKLRAEGELGGEIGLRSLGEGLRGARVTWVVSVCLALVRAQRVCACVQKAFCACAIDEQTASRGDSRATRG